VFDADERGELCRAADCALAVTGRARHMGARIATAATYLFMVAPPMSLRTTARSGTGPQPRRYARSGAHAAQHAVCVDLRLCLASISWATRLKLWGVGPEGQRMTIRLLGECYTGLFSLCSGYDTSGTPPRWTPYFGSKTL
jgi:hypothetical protein